MAALALLALGAIYGGMGIATELFSFGVVKLITMMTNPSIFYLLDMAIIGFFLNHYIKTRHLSISFVDEQSTKKWEGNCFYFGMIIMHSLLRILF